VSRLISGERSTPRILDDPATSSREAHDDTGQASER